MRPPAEGEGAVLAARRGVYLLMFHGICLKIKTVGVGENIDKPCHALGFGRYERLDEGNMHRAVTPVK